MRYSTRAVFYYNFVMSLWIIPYVIVFSFSENEHCRQKADSQTGDTDDHRRTADGDCKAVGGTAVRGYGLAADAADAGFVAVMDGVDVYAVAVTAIDTPNYFTGALTVYRGC